PHRTLPSSLFPYTTLFRSYVQHSHFLQQKSIMAFLLEMVGKYVYYPDTTSFADKKLSSWLSNITGGYIRHYHFVNSIYDSPSHIHHCKNNDRNSRTQYTYHILALNLYYLILLVRMLQSIQKQNLVHSTSLSCLSTSYRMIHDDLHLLKQGYYLQKHLSQLFFHPFHHLISGY